MLPFYQLNATLLVKLRTTSLNRNPLSNKTVDSIFLFKHHTYQTFQADDGRPHNSPSYVSAHSEHAAYRPLVWYPRNDLCLAIHRLLRGVEIDPILLMK